MDSQRTQPGWTQDQWTRIDQVVEAEFNKVRIAAKFLPEYGGTIRPKERDVPAQRVDAAKGTINDVERKKLVDIWAKFTLNKQQIEDEELSSALVLFRRAANVLARLEDAIIFNGQPAPNKRPTVIIKLPRIEVIGDEKMAKKLVKKYEDANKQIKILDYFTKISFLLGIVMFLVFACINLFN